MFGLDLFHTKADKAFMDRVKGDQAKVKAARIGGLSSIIDKRQAALDAYAEKVNGFMNAVDEHFAQAGVAEFLTDAYDVTTKFDGVEVGTRDLRMRWMEINDDFHYSLGFSCVEVHKGQLDVHYMASVKTRDFNEQYQRPNPDYKSGGTNAVITVLGHEDKFQTSRTYHNFADFVAKKPEMPKWFVEMLKASIPPR